MNAAKYPSDRTRILVLGGAGYLGSVMVPTLLSKGYFVTVVDNLMYNQSSLFDCCSNRYFEFFENSITNHSFVNQLLPKYDVVIPLAALVGAPLCDANPKLANSTNFDAYMNIVRNLDEQHVVIFPTTNSGYGIGSKDSYCTEQSPLRPISSYGKAKVDIEAAFLEKRNAITYRLATVFGMSPRMRMDLLVNDFVYRAISEKRILLYEEHFRRNYIHIRDVANAFCFGIENYAKMKGEPYNVGLSSANLTKRELCERIKLFVPDLDITSSKAGSDPDKRDYLVSNEKIESLGWRANHTLEMGIEELIKGYKIVKDNYFANK